MTGTKFVERIDQLLKEKNIKRQALADSIGIDASNFAHWKTKNYLPDVTIAYNIARFLNVSIEWLLTGKLVSEWISTDFCKLNPNDIFDRLEDRIRWLTSNHSSESKIKPEILYSYLTEIVDKETLLAWKHERLLLDITLLYRISVKLDVQFQWLLTGVDPRTPTIEHHVIRLAEKYPSHLKFYDNLPESDINTVDRVTEALFHLTRKKE